jgi:hypothetical protein
MKAGVAVSAILAFVLPAPLRGEEFPEYKARATFIYHLADNVEWKEHPIRLCTYGYDAATQHLEKLSQIPGEEKHIVIRRNVPFEQIPSCHILYVSKAGSRVLPEIIEESRKGDVLTISDIQDFTLLGGMMGFDIRRNRVTLKANKTALREAGIRLSPSLLNILPDEAAP